MMVWQDFRLHQRLNLHSPAVEEVYTLIAGVDAVKNSLDLTKHWWTQTLDRLTRSVIITSTGASNRIEGNRLSNVEVEHLYKSMHIKKFKTRDEQEIAGYVECLERIFEHYEVMKVSESMILNLHQDMLVYSERDQGHKGHYKAGSNRVEAKDSQGQVVGVIFDPTPPYLVPKEMHELIDWYHWAITQKQKHPLILIANFIFEYLAIHPFQDGNGRTSRLLTNLMLLHHGYLFTRLVSHEQIVEHHKIDYYIALNKAQSTWKSASEDMVPWLLFFLRVVQEQSRKALALFEKDHTEHLLSEKQRMLWHWAQEKGSAFSRKDAIEALGFPARTIESVIQKLVDLKKLKRLGQGRATRYTPVP